MNLPEIITDIIISYLDLKSILVLSRANEFWYIRTCLGLKVLDMTEFSTYSDIGFILKRFNKLHTLITHNSFSCVKLECLRVLIINGLQEEMNDFVTFLSYSKALRDVTINESIGYQNDKVLYTLADNATLLNSLETDQAYDITNAGLNRLFIGCKFLKELSIMNCPNITKDAFMNITNLNLTKINLKKCRLLCNDVLCQLSRTCLNLSDLDISNNALISEVSSLSSLIHLSSLILSGCYLLNDQSFARFSNYSLSNLDISFCNSITDDGLSYILSNCPKLNSMHLQEASGISLNGIDVACKLKNGIFYGSILELNR